MVLYGQRENVALDTTWNSIFAKDGYKLGNMYENDTEKTTMAYLAIFWIILLNYFIEYFFEEKLTAIAFEFYRKEHLFSMSIHFDNVYWLSDGDLDSIKFN